VWPVLLVCLLLGVVFLVGQRSEIAPIIFGWVPVECRVDRKRLQCRSSWINPKYYLARRSHRYRSTTA
jgi:hypothetical protein